MALCNRMIDSERTNLLFDPAGAKLEDASNMSELSRVFILFHLVWLLSRAVRAHILLFFAGLFQLNSSYILFSEIKQIM